MAKPLSKKNVKHSSTINTAGLSHNVKKSKKVFEDRKFTKIVPPIVIQQEKVWKNTKTDNWHVVQNHHRSAAKRLKRKAIVKFEEETKHLPKIAVSIKEKELASSLNQIEQLALIKIEKSKSQEIVNRVVNKDSFYQQNLDRTKKKNAIRRRKKRHQRFQLLSTIAGTSQHKKGKVPAMVGDLNLNAAKPNVSKQVTELPEIRRERKHAAFTRKNNIAPPSKEEIPFDPEFDFDVGKKLKALDEEVKDMSDDIFLDSDHPRPHQAINDFPVLPHVPPKSALKKKKSKFDGKILRDPDIFAESRELTYLIKGPSAVELDFSYFLTDSTIAGMGSSIPYATSIVAFVWQMVRSRNFGDYAAAVHQFAMICANEDIKKNLIETLLNHTRDLWPICSEALSDTLTGLYTKFEMIMHSELLTHLRSFILTIVSYAGIDKETAARFNHWLGAVKPMSFFDFIPTVFKMCISAVRLVESYLAGISVWDYILEKDPVLAALEEADMIMTFSANLYTGLPVPGYMCIKEFVSKLTRIQTFLIEVSSKMTPFVAHYSRIRRTLVQVSSQVNSQRSIVDSARRAPPIGIIFDGDPGIGKSVIMPYVFKLWSTVKGREFSDSHVFHRILSSDYWEGYNPFSHPFIHYSELGSKHAKLAASQGDPAVLELTSVVDSLPYTVNMASVELKGKVNAIPEMVAIDTNFKDLNLSVLVKHVAAVQRRFLVITSEVKEQFRKEGSPSLDTFKSLAAGGDLLDRWTFTVEQRIPLNCVSSRSDYLMRGGNIYDLERVLSAHFEKFIREQEDVRRLSISRYAPRPGDAFLQGIVERRKRCNCIVCECHLPTVLCWCDDICCKEHSFVGSPIYRLCSPPIRSEARFLEQSLPQKNSYKQWLFDFLHYVKQLSCVTVPSVLSITGMILMFIIFKIFWAVASACFCEFGKYISDMLLSKIQDRKRRLTNQIFSDRHSHMMLIFAGFMASWLAYRTLWKTKYAECEAVTLFSQETPQTKEINEHEDKSECVATVTRIPVKDTPYWNAKVNLPSTLVMKNDVVNINHTMKHNMRVAEIVSDGSRCATCLLGIRGNIAMANRHPFSGLGPWVVNVRNNGSGPSPVSYSTKLRTEDIHFLSEDIVLFEVSGTRFRDITEYITLGDVYRPSKAYISGTATRVRPERSFTMMHGNVQITLPLAYAYDWQSHSSGFCGSPLVIEIGNAYALCGIHCAGRSSTPESFAAPFTKSQVMLGLKTLESRNEMVIVSECYDFGTLTEPNDKSPFRYESLQGLVLYGQLPGHVEAKGKSKIVKNSFGHRIEAMFKCSIHDNGRPLFGAPLMQAATVNGEYLSPYNRALKEMSSTKKPLDKRILTKIIDELVDRYVSALPDLSPLTLEAAINGVDGDPFTRRINSTTSAGFGFDGKKSQHIPLSDPTTHKREPTPALQQRLLDILHQYGEGKCGGVVYNAHLKDEVRSMEKIKRGATRVFYGSPLDNLILQRMYLYPFYTSMMEHGDIFCSSVGIDMHSGADSFVTKLLSFSSKFMEGDYGSFDLNMPFEIGQATNEIIMRVLKRKGYTSHALTIVRGLLSDNSFPVINMLKTVFEVAGLQPSGKYATAEDNSLRSKIMIMYCFYHIFPDLNFFHHVCPRTYGDDLLAAVKDSVLDKFNNNVYATFCSEHFGIAYTSADKSAVFPPYISIHQSTFLKRSFWMSPILNRWVAKLEIKSIVKSAYFRLPSKHVSEEHQMIDIARATLYEWIFHIREQKEYDYVFEQWVDILSTQYGAYPEDLREELPTYHYLLSVFNKPDDDLDDRGVDNSTQPAQAPTAESRVTQCNDFLEIERYEQLLKQAQQQLKETQVFSGMSARELRNKHHYYSYPGQMQHYRERLDQLARIQDLELTLQSLRLKSPNAPIFIDVPEAESSADIHDGIPTNVASHGTVTDIMGDMQNMINSGVQKSVRAGQHSELPMDDFFNRPIMIANGSFVLGATTDLGYSVWDLYTINPAVRAKLRNYAYLRGNLHLKIEISGTPMHYGKVMISYQPYPARNANLGDFNTFGAVMRPGRLCYLSQSQHAIIMDVRENKPAEIVCDFMSHKHMHRLYNSAAGVISDVTSYEDLSQAGDLYLVTLNTPRAVSTTATDLKFFIYAWMTEIELGTSTGTQVAIRTESAQIDERESGPVEKMSSAMASISNTLTQIPILRPYAFASTIAFSSLEKVSSIFGWSRPNVIDSPVYVKNNPYQNGANTIAHDTAYKLTLDPKQELTVDPRCLAVEEDEMVISYLSARQSYLTTFTFANTDVALVPIWKCAVTPILDVITNPSGVSYMVQPTSMSFAAQPFSSWRGDIEFTFDFVVSSFHRGKLAIIYEPNITQDTLIAANINLNKQYVKIVDLQETQSVSICVEWASPRSWRKILKYSADQIAYTSPGAGRGTFTLLAQDFYNGMIYVVPVNDLISPDSNSISVNVSVSCPNLMVNRLARVNLPSGRHYPAAASAILAESARLSSQEVACYPLNPSTAATDFICAEHFGERPVSFRALMKRFVTLCTATGAVAIGKNTLTFTDSILPEIGIPYGNFPTADYNRDLWNYLRFAYMGMRGSIKKRIRFIDQRLDMPSAGAIVSLENEGSVSPSPSYLPTTLGPLTNRTDLNGSVVYDLHNNSGVEVELPFYSRNLYHYAFAYDGVGTNPGGDPNFDTVWTRTYKATVSFTSAVSDFTYVNADCAAGEDFIFFRYMGAPHYSRL